LQEDNDIAIVLLMSITENGHTAQEYMKNIAEYYQLPVISYADALTYMFENGKMTWKDFSDDQSHPNKGGHKLVCEMIAHYYDTVEAQPQEEEPAMPVAPFYSSRQEYVTMYEATDLFPSEYGSFNGQTSTAGFKNGWKYMPDGKNEPAVFEITGKFIYMIFREQSSGDLGVLDVTIRCDGEIVAETQVNGIQPSAWGDPGIQTLHMDTSVKTYTIEVKMAEGSEDKNFQILAFAATDK
ncbi:MAG: SGNH/GDSL hydrolase family protein, partial [Oscillospiraceae bacterium]|nr:SGNH/GDSL hydrolase family protein [Oscillospiraceae bacterium]